MLLLKVWFGNEPLPYRYTPFAPLGADSGPLLYPAAKNPPLFE